MPPGDLGRDERTGRPRRRSATWPPLVKISHLAGEPYVTAGSAPALTAAYDQLIGPGRWTRQVNVGRAVVVRFPASSAAARATTSKAATPVRTATRSTCDRAAGGCSLCSCSPTLAPMTHQPAWSAARTCTSPSSWPPTARTAPPPTPSSGGRPSSAAKSRTLPAQPATCSCATRSSSTPRPGRTVALAPRMIAQPAVHVADGFALDGADPSPVAQAIVVGLAMAS